MGSAARSKPTRLAEKLVRIRTALNLSQNEMITRLGLTDELIRENISSFELGKREPSVLVLLAYARVANVWVDVLIDDALDLPEQLPSLEKSRGIERRASLSQRRKR
jgi:transcriptional regulator with XRE-family HTH domain